MGILGKTLDNIITSIDPEKGLKRMAARQKMGYPKKSTMFSALSLSVVVHTMPLGLFTAKSTGLGLWLLSTRTIFPLQTTFCPGVTFCPMEAGRLSTSTLPASIRRSASRLEQTPIRLSHLFKRSSIFSRFLLSFPQSLPLLSSRMGRDKHSIPKGEETVTFLHCFPVGV